jgi:hypothetical protein
MTRTLSVAGALAVLLFAYWLPNGNTGKYPLTSMPLSVLDAPHPGAIATAEPAAPAMDDLAAWPIAAHR